MPPEPLMRKSRLRDHRLGAPLSYFVQNLERCHVTLNRRISGDQARHPMREAGASAHFVVIGRRLVVIGGAGERVDAPLSALDRVEQRQIRAQQQQETRG